MPKLSATITTEQGYVAGNGATPYGANRGIYGGFIWDPAEHAAELQWPYNVAIYDRMRRTDAQVKAGQRAIIQTIMARRLRLDPNGAADQIVQHVSADLAVPVLGQEATPPARTRGRFTLREHLPLALLSLSYGHMFFQQVYRIDGTGTSATAHLAKLSPRMPATLSAIEVAPDGGLIGIRQYGNAAADRAAAVTIGVDRLVAYTHEREGGNWQGNSILRAVYKDYLMKDRLLRVSTIAGERTGMGTPVVEMPENVPNAPGEVAKYEQIAAAARVGETSGLALPHGARLRYVGVEGTLPDLLAQINYHDVQIAQNVGLSVLKLGTNGNSGNRALGETLMEFYNRQVDAVAEELLNTVNAHVVEDIVDLNYGDGERAPRVVLLPADPSTDLTPEQIKTLIDSGAVSVDEGFEEYVRSRFRLPARTSPRPVAAPVAPRNRARAPRAPRNAAGEQPMLPLGDLPEPFADLYAKRDALVSTQLDALTPRLVALAAAADLGPAADRALAGDTSNSLTPEEQALAQLIEDGMRAAEAEIEALTDEALQGMRTAWATGQAEGATLLAVGDTAIDYAMVFDKAFAAAADLDSLLEQAGGWVEEQIGVSSRSAAQAVTDILTDTTVTRTELIRGMAADIGDAKNAEVLYDYALTTSLGEGSRRRYEDAGLDSVDFLTAADDRVDQHCVDAAAGNAHPLGDAPVPPLHINCRCCLAPSTQGIRDLLLGG